jgi:hypothetical protein
MIRMKLLLAGAFVAAVALSVGTASAQGPTDQRTFFTFSAPFELPGGKTLPAGKYTFRIVDSPSNRHIVQILSEDGKQVHSTILAIPAQRQDPPSEPEVRFMEAAANMPPAIRTWWYPGRTIGHEFIYPKEQARRLASRQSEPVLTVDTDATSAEQMQRADLERVGVNGQETAVTPDNARNAQTEAPRQAAAQPAPEPMRSEPQARTRARSELPRTASPLPLTGLIGLASLAGAVALRLRRRSR